MTYYSYYEADDGTRFDDEEECFRYERAKELEPFINDITCYNERLNPIDLVENDWDDIWYITAKNAKALEAFNKIYAVDAGYTEVLFDSDTIYCYYFDENSQEWVNIPRKIEELQDLAKEIGLKVEVKYNED
jgi:hypothetical protein